MIGSLAVRLPEVRRSEARQDLGIFYGNKAL